MRWIICICLVFAFGCDTAIDSSPGSSEASLDVAAKGPFGSHGKKDVGPMEFDWPETCDGEEVMFHYRGWYQSMAVSGQRHNDALTVYHLEVSYTDSDGNDVVVWHDVGPDHLYYDRNGDLMWSVTGRSTATYVNGHVVFNVSQGEIEVLTAGREFDLCDYR